VNDSIAPPSLNDTARSWRTWAVASSGRSRRCAELRSDRDPLPTLQPHWRSPHRWPTSRRRPRRIRGGQRGPKVVWLSLAFGDRDESRVRAEPDRPKSANHLRFFEIHRVTIQFFSMRFDFSLTRIFASSASWSILIKSTSTSISSSRTSIALSRSRPRTFW